MPANSAKPSYRRLSIGRLQDETGVLVTTIRYYEKIGLIDPPRRTEGGQRDYDENAIERLRFIRHTRDLGFSIEAIRELIALGSDPDQSCETADDIAQRHLGDVRQRIRQLRRLEKELKRMVESCAGGVVGTCHVMAVLSDHDLCATDRHERLATAPPTPA